jgi:hypothetical protein
MNNFLYEDHSDTLMGELNETDFSLLGAGNPRIDSCPKQISDSEWVERKLEQECWERDAAARQRQKSSSNLFLKIGLCLAAVAGIAYVVLNKPKPLGEMINDEATGVSGTQPIGDPKVVKPVAQLAGKSLGSATGVSGTQRKGDPKVVKPVAQLAGKNLGRVRR